MKRVMMVGGVVILALGAFAFAQMVPDKGGEAESSISAAAEDQGSDGFFTVPDPRSEEERKADDDFFRLDLGPEVDVSGVERVPSAADNQPYRTCEKPPEVQARFMESRAYRDIAGYLSVTNVIATRDCTCAGKVVSHDAIAAFESQLRERLGVDVLRAPHTDDLFQAYERDVKVVAAMCGEY